MNTNTSLQGLVEKARERDEHAFHALFDMHADKIFSYAFSRVGDRDASKDITQDTFIALWHSLPSFSYQGEEAFLGFIFVIAKRRIMKHYTAQTKERTHTVPLDQDEKETGDGHLVTYDEYRELAAGLTRLNQKYQEVLRLRYWGTLSFLEIGEALGIAENAARVLHHRALKKLRAAITS